MPVLVLQMAMGDYRQVFLDVLEEEGFHGKFLVGDQHFSRGLKTRVRSSIVESTGRNLFFLGRRFAFQRGVCFRAILNKEAVVVELNPRIFSSWVIVAVRRAFGRTTYGWGHANARSGPSSKSNKVRRMMQRLCTGLIMYTYSEAAQISSVLPGKDVLVAANALYRACDIIASPMRKDPSDFVVIGRLVFEKKPILALDAFERVLPKLPDRSCLHFVGEGPSGHEISARIAASPELKERVVSHGHVWDRPELRDIFDRCVAMLAPGYVGLNATQSLGFGVPVIFSKDEPHAPEIELLDPANSVSFRSDDVADLAQCIEAASENASLWISRGPEIADNVRSMYSAEAMAMTFCRLEGTM